MESRRSSLCFRVILAVLLLQYASGCTDQPVGVEHSNIIPNNRFSASTKYDARFPAYKGRLNGATAWAPTSSDPNKYLQIDLDDMYIICAVGTQGSGSDWEWVTSYKVELSMDNQQWHTYQDGGGDKTFIGNADRTTEVKHTLTTPTMARFMRFKPLPYHRDSSMRVEVYGIRTKVCKSTLGLVNNLIPDSSISASSGQTASAGRLYGGSSWCSSTSNTAQYFEVDLGQVKTVTGIATQGDPTAEKWIETYWVKFSFDAATWIPYDAATTSKKTLTGNSNKNEAVINWLSHPFKARHVRVNPRTWNTSICLRIDLYGDIDCSCENIALGMEDWRIPVNRITPSSNTASAGRARLGTTAGSWCASPSDVTPYLQMDLGSSHVICAVATQGNPTADQWVQAYRVMMSTNGVNWTMYSENNQSRTFYGNYDRSSVVRQVLYKSPISRYLRIEPVHYIGSRCIRIELYGSRMTPDCQSHAAGLQSQKMIPDYRFTATSWYTTDYYPWYARLGFSKPWATTTADRDSSPYIQVDLGDLYYICASSTQGTSYNSQEWVKTYKLSYSNDNVTWTTYTEDGIEKKFVGNKEKTSIVTRNISVPMLAKFVRLHPTAYKSYPTLRLDYSGLVSGCASSLGVEKGLVRNSELSASSHSDSSHSASAGRLYGGSSWCSSTSNIAQYLEVDLGQVKTVTGIATQGDPTADKWVRTYVIKHSFAGTEWFDVKDGQPSAKTFVGNSGRHTGQVNWFSIPFAGRFIRVFPNANQGGACMRMDLYGCGFVFSPKVQSRSVTLAATRDTSIPLTCSKGYDKSLYVKWYKNGIQLEGQTTNQINIIYTTADEVMKMYRCERAANPAIRTVNCSLAYSCAARYESTVPSAATAEASIMLHVQLNVLTAPIISVIAKKRSLVLSLSVTSSDDTGSLAEYIVSYQNTSSTAQTISIGTTSPYEFTNLKPYTNYSIKARGHSVVGEGLWTTDTVYRTLMADPEGKVNITSQQAESSTSIRITWKHSSDFELNGLFRDYVIEYTHTGSHSNVTVNDTMAKSHLITSLSKFTKYTLTIAARNTDYKGTVSNEVTVQTLEDVPEGMPVINALQASTSTAINMTWMFTDFNTLYGDMAGFYITYTPEGGADKHVTVGSITEYTISGLEKFTNYSVTVAVRNHKYTGPPTQKKRVQTQEDAPLPPSVGKISGSTNITLWTAEQRNGPISWYQVIVFREIKSENKNLTDFQAESLDDYRTAEEKDLHYYITAELPSSDMGVDKWMIVGKGNNYTGARLTYVNVRLDETRQHKIYIRAMTYINSKVYQGEVALVAIVPANPSVTKENIDTDQPIGAIIGGVVAAIAVLALVMIAVLYMRRRADQSRDNKRDIHLDAIDDRTQEQGSQVSLVDEVPRNGQGNEGCDDIYDEALDNPCKPIPITQFPEYVNQMRTNCYIRLHDEYKNLESSQQLPWTIARKPVNKKKNRYANILPYDHSRVILERVDDDEDSDFVNASFLRRYDGNPSAYIASQGPVPPSFEGFWRMIWEQNTASIIMLTNLEELGKTKCHQYWPEEKETYGQIRVICHLTEKFGDYLIRTFIVTKANTSVKRWVRQFHFTVWPDKGVPQYATAVLAFRRKVCAMNPGNAGPVVVHCSAGVGRTGAYVVIDAMLERAKGLRSIDIRNYVIAIRKDRPHMVQTADQYVFIHLAILEALSCGNTEIASQNLAVAIHKLGNVDHRRQLTGYALEFQRLEHVSRVEITSEEISIGQSTVNASKNRHPDTIALNRCRVILHQEYESDADYINAAFVDAHRERNAFIMTPAPMEHTIADFWRMITDYNIGTIVMLNDVQEGDECYPQYWPQQGTTPYDDITVEAISSHSMVDIVSTKLRVSRYSKTMDVNHFRHVSWPDKGIPERAQSILDLLNEVQSSQQQTANAPVVVQCSNGVGRSGTFCAIASVLERLKTEQVVDVFQTIKRIRVNRPGAVDGLTQYEFCYHIIQTYLDSFSDYANFTDC